MAHPLDGAWAKLARASEHFEELERKIAVAPDYADALFFEQQFDADAGTIEITLQGVPEVPIAWGLILADYLQTLRAALNYLTWELSRWNLARNGITRDPRSATQFPINTFARQFDAYRLPDVDACHVARIKALQPNAADHLAGFSERLLQNASVDGLAGRHPLAQLAQLTNEDKHRALPGLLVSASDTVIGSYTPTDCEIVHVNHFMQIALQNGAKWATLQVVPTGPEPKVEVDDRVRIAEVEFGRVPVSAMPDIGQAVADILTEFAPTF